MSGYKYRLSGANLPNRSSMNLIAGDNVTISVSDDEANDELEATIALNDASSISQVYVYDFSVLGGGTGAKTLVSETGAAQTIPDNAIIVAARIEGITTPTSGGSATIAVGITGDATSILGATAYDAGGFDANAVSEPASFSPFKTSAAVSVLATIGTAALTAGKFRVYIDYKQGV